MREIDQDNAARNIEDLEYFHQDKIYKTILDAMTEASRAEKVVEMLNLNNLLAIRGHQLREARKGKTEHSQLDYGK